MQAGPDVQFKTLLTLQEYGKLIERFKGNRTDFQTNHYFDTKRFSLKALDASLRVRDRDTLELTFKRKKGYTMQEYTIPISNEVLKEMRETGIVPEEEIHNELIPLIGDQKVYNFLSLSTFRMYLPYKNGVLFIDKSDYLGVTDYELEYLGKNYHEAKKEFIQIIGELEIIYKKADKKIKRAFKAYKRKP
ncbi:MAG: CYTH domain-containing protein [Bacilli bacterium]|nr:CYTH domain-containing protein [Bacilli bacterium]